MTKEELKKRREELEEINKNIEKASIYDAEIIGTILAKLMSKFEGTEYVYNHHHNNLHEQNYQEFPVTLYLPSNERKLRYSTLNKKVRQYYLPPIYNTEEDYIKNNDLSYVKNFLEYLTTARYNLGLYTITDKQLAEFLEGYIKIKEQEIKERNKCRIEYQKEMEAKVIEQKRKDNCMIERKSFFTALVNLLNTDETFNFNASEKYENILHLTSGVHTIKTQHSLIAHTLLKKIKINKEINSTRIIDGTDLNEVNIDYSLKPLINFYTFKEEFIDVYQSSNLIKEFIDEIEKGYELKSIISEEDILYLCEFLSKENDKKRSLTKTTA